MFALTRSRTRLATLECRGVDAKLVLPQHSYEQMLLLGSDYVLWYCQLICLRHTEEKAWTLTSEWHSEGITKIVLFALYIVETYILELRNNALHILVLLSVFCTEHIVRE